MDAFAAASYGKSNGGEAEDDEATDRLVALPWSWATCTELWTAWREHGVMPLRGGYLDQPRAWRQMLRFFSSRYGYAAQAYRGSGGGNDDGLDDFLSGISVSAGDLFE